LARICGKAVANYLCLTGQIIGADEALRIGLVNQLHEPADLLPAAETLARKIAANAPQAVRFAMEAIDRGMDVPLDQGLGLEATLFGLCCSSEDMREGTAAFLEKRPPQFRGR
jgi:enoyl-CoA hydratase